MRIVKSAAIKGSDEEFVFMCFDKVLKSLFSTLKYESVKISAADKTCYILKENDLTILIDKNAFYVKTKDEKFTSILIAKNLLYPSIEYDAPETIKNIIVFRQINKLGLSEHLSYYFYVCLNSIKNNRVEDFIEANVPWIVYEQGDNYYSELFYKFSKSMDFPKDYWKKCDALFKIMKKDILFSDNLERASRLYKKLVS